MANGKFLLLVIAVCWCAAAVLIAGSLLARLSFIRKLGRLVQWLAFVAYLLGLVGTAMLIDAVMAREGGGSLALLVLGLTFIPLGGCTVSFYKAFRAWRLTRAQPVPTQGP